MKGLTHFISGVALASCFTPVMAASAAGRSGVPGANASFMLLLAGLFGIMPDTLDFKVGAFFSPADIEIDFDINDPDPADMARQVGEAMDQAAETGKTVKVQFHPMRLGSNFWRQYVIKHDMTNNEVAVIINEVVTTSQIPFEGSAPPDDKRVGRYKLKSAKVVDTHGRPNVVDILSGPQLGYRPDGKDVYIEFLPWHRTWSHSYVLGLLLSLPVWAITFFMGFELWFWYGLVSFLGFAVHITEDLTGHMGGSLIWPFSKTRFDGLHLFSAANPHANFSVDYAAVIIIMYNMHRVLPPESRVFPEWVNFWTYFLVFLVFPLAIYFWVARITGFGATGKKEGAMRAESVLARNMQIRNEEAIFENENFENDSFELSSCKAEQT